MCLSRCDALMVYVARPGTGKNRVVVDIGIHGLVPVWHREYRPCLIDRVLHFVPDQDASGPAFKLTKRGLKHAAALARKSVVSGNSVSVRVDSGGRHDIKKKKR